MPKKLQSELLGGRLAVDFANLGRVFSAGSLRPLTWAILITFLEAAKVVSPERGARLLLLTRSDPDAAEGLLAVAKRLQAALYSGFSALAAGNRFEKESSEVINGILQVTEGHDELVWDGRAWRMEFIAREDSPEWLLAAIARSAAEIVADQQQARLRSCANPECGLLFSDTSRTRKRRWCSMATCGNRHKVAEFARRHAPKHPTARSNARSGG
jgi:predicted RNA-binding Zn ribbon-like protein